MELGYLEVQVRTASGAKPIADAAVIILQDGIEIYRYTTNASGSTPVAEIQAPDKELSLDRNYTGYPYAVCTVVVNAKGYYSYEVVGVQIFASQKALLPVSVEPLKFSDRSQPTEVRRIEIPNHNLNIPSVNNADLPPEGSRVLPAVVIPSTVTVHLGRPDVYAENVTVSFTDYIKNVCCSEIYPTWPVEALRANIYCQISLVLNRVYTEWYRSRGYSFDITNSTSYDQYFVYGRNIYESVSAVVDEIFNVFMRKSNFQEPFYAEYCNGTTATCPGLKQWGTLELANEGYSAIEILRYYYGNLINLYTTNVVQGVQSSYPGTALRRGSTGSAVRTIQNQLIRIRQNFPQIPSPGTPDGIFGAATQAAVRQFQEIFDLTVDGVVGKATWYRISYIFVAVKKLAELTSEGITGPSIAPAYPSVVLRIGSRGDYVLLAQYMLDLASDFIPLQTIAIDGIFGNATYNAVRSFQRDQGLNADGVIGPLTWEALYDVYFGILEDMHPAPEYPDYLLQYGSAGSAVSTIQRFLSVIGLYFETIPALAIDGIFGSGTYAAVVAFQIQFGLVPDGIVGPLTWNAIVSVYQTIAN